MLILIATLFVALSFRPTLFHLNSSLENSQNLKPKICVNDVFEEELQKKISSGYVNFENVEICLEKQANWESGSQTFTIFELAETIVSASQAIAKNKDVIISVSEAELCEKNCVLYLKIQFFVYLLIDQKTLLLSHTFFENTYFLTHSAFYTFITIYHRVCKSAFVCLHGKMRVSISTSRRRRFEKMATK